MGFEPPMNGPIQDADTRHSSSIKLVDATNGKRLPHERPLLSSVPFGWRGIVVESASPEAAGNAGALCRWPWTRRQYRRQPHIIWPEGSRQAA